MPEMHQGTVVLTQPPHYVTMHTRETAKHCAAFGLSDEQTCVILKCTLDDLRKNYANEMEHGLALINAQVQANVLHQALYKDDVQAMKLWLINKAGWRAGDAPRGALSATNPVDRDGNEIPVFERRTVIERILTKAVQVKRESEKVVDGRVVSTQGRGAGQKGNGNGAAHAPNNGADSGGHGPNGSGVAGNGAKHK